jgi:hypothetical protein
MICSWFWEGVGPFAGLCLPAAPMDQVGPSQVFKSAFLIVPKRRKLSNWPVKEICHQTIIFSSSLFPQTWYNGYKRFPTVSRKENTMSGRIIEVDVHFSIPRAQFEQEVTPLADSIARVDGLHWKIWLMNEAESRFGGVYLFEDEASAAAYLSGPIVTQFAKHPAVSDIRVKQFDVMEELSAITRGPVYVSATTA